MISKNRSKFIKSLQLKKFRGEHGLFVVEGGKNVLEVLDSRFEVVELYFTEAFLKDYQPEIKTPYQLASESELTAAGSLQSNKAALALVRLPSTSFSIPAADEFVIALDDVRDPGNLGTIVRIADWYGIKRVYCSEETTDAFAPKVVQACMGSLTRVEICYCSLERLISESGLPVFGALLEGDNVHEMAFGKQGILLMGNESHGISAPLRPLINRPVTIPRYGGAESLNVAIATAVLCDNLRRSGYEG